jgi:phosphopantothenoylcysteine decarboxylase / phosphopantothenate---cysteine ligase
VKKKILLGVTGSIAAYKSAELVRKMVKKDWEVSVVMTKSATLFIGEVTMRTLSRNPVSVEMFPAGGEWKPEHISLAEWPDLFVIAPCTANVLAKMAHGIADDLLTCTALACGAPILAVPAMNEKMWNNPATRENVATLRKRGVHMAAVGRGDLACGWEGAGRMLEPEEIVKLAERILSARKKRR